MTEKERVAGRIEELRKEAAEGGYHLNSDEEMVYDLVDGLLTNKDRYGMEICPCRLLAGKPENNLDIVCPCDYRDVDIAENGACFCALYVSPDTTEKGTPVKQIEERRKTDGKTENNPRKDRKDDLELSDGDYPLWRCRVCGYLCANKYPPMICPICKAKQERFEKMAINLRKA